MSSIIYSLIIHDSRDVLFTEWEAWKWNDEKESEKKIKFVADEVGT